MPYLTVLPKYDKEKSYQREKVPKNISRHLQHARRANGPQYLWVAAEPTGHNLNAAAGPLKVRWRMLVEEGGYRTPDRLPRLLAAYGHLINSVRLDGVDEVIRGEGETDESGSEEED